MYNVHTCIYIHIHLYSVPHRARLQIEPISGMNLKSWSLDYYIPRTTPYGDGLGCYFIQYTRGTGNGLTKFWIEVEVSLKDCYGNRVAPCARVVQLFKSNSRHHVYTVITMVTIVTMVIQPTNYE